MEPVISCLSSASITLLTMCPPSHSEEANEPPPLYLPDLTTYHSPLGLSDLATLAFLLYAMFSPAFHQLCPFLSNI